MRQSISNDSSNLLCRLAVVTRRAVPVDLHRDALVGIYESLGATLDVVWLYCDPRTMYTYLRRRGAARDGARLTDWQNYVTGIDTDLPPQRAAHRRGELLRQPPLQEQAKALIGRLDVG